MASPTVVKSGFLLKASRHTRTWKSRWVAVSHEDGSYYLSSFRRGSAVFSARHSTERMNLRGATVLLVTKDDLACPPGVVGNHVFALALADLRVFHFCCVEADNSWLLAINACIAAADDRDDALQSANRVALARAMRSWRGGCKRVDGGPQPVHSIHLRLRRAVRCWRERCVALSTASAALRATEASRPRLRRAFAALRRAGSGGPERGEVVAAVCRARLRRLEVGFAGLHHASRFWPMRRGLVARLQRDAPRQRVLRVWRTWASERWGEAQRRAAAETLLEARTPRSRGVAVSCAFHRLAAHGRRQRSERALGVRRALLQWRRAAAASRPRREMLEMRRHNAALLSHVASLAGTVQTLAVEARLEEVAEQEALLLERLQEDDADAGAVAKLHALQAEVADLRRLGENLICGGGVDGYEAFDSSAPRQYPTDDGSYEPFASPGPASPTSSSSGQYFSASDRSDQPAP